MAIGKVMERWGDVGGKIELSAPSHFVEMSPVHGQRAGEMCEQSRE